MSGVQRSMWLTFTDLMLVSLAKSIGRVVNLLPLPHQHVRCPRQSSRRHLKYKCSSARHDIIGKPHGSELSLLRPAASC